MQLLRLPIASVRDSRINPVCGILDVDVTITRPEHFSCVMPQRWGRDMLDMNYGRCQALQAHRIRKFSLQHCTLDLRVQV